MNTCIDNTFTIEAISTHAAEESVGLRYKEGGVQFWSCTAFSCFLLLLGAWLLWSTTGPKSVSSYMIENAAATAWLCIPTFLGFAWQGYRKMRASQDRSMRA